jgi:O-acetyl-ADP-ribose deacetylase
MAAFRIEASLLDICTADTDAIVNAANETLLGGGGVDGAIHDAAGPELLRACTLLPEVSLGVRCPTGEARITQGFNLPCRYVIHTVGPVWHGGGYDEERLLASCYLNSLRLAKEYDVRSIAFPAISTGAFGFPAARAARIAVTNCLQSLATLAPHAVDRIVFACFDSRSLDVMKKELSGRTN